MPPKHRMLAWFALSIAALLWFSQNAAAQPNLTPYQPFGWSDKIVVSNITGTNTDSTTLTTFDNLYVDWAIVNNGTTATTAGFTVSLYVDGVLRYSWGCGTLNPTWYCYVTDSTILGTLSAGTHAIKIVADTTNT